MQSSRRQPGTEISSGGFPSTPFEAVPPLGGLLCILRLQPTVTSPSCKGLGCAGFAPEESLLEVAAPYSRPESNTRHWVSGRRFGTSNPVLTFLFSLD